MAQDGTRDYWRPPFLAIVPFAFPGHYIPSPLCLWFLAIMKSKQAHHISSKASPKTNRHTIEKGKTCGIASHHTHHKKEEEQQQQQTSCVGRMAGRSSPPKKEEVYPDAVNAVLYVWQTHNHNNSI